MSGRLAAYTRDGRSPAVLLLHGVFMDHTLWDQVLKLRSDVRAVALDMPGHGASDPAGLTNLDAAMDAVTSTLTAEDALPVVIVGHSWGGMVGLRLAVARPDLVRGLVLSNTPLVRNHGLTRIGFHAQRALLAAGLPSTAYGRMAARSLVGADYLSDHPDVASQMAARLSTMGRTRIRQTLTSVLLAPHDTVHLLGEIQVPWRAVGGAQDYAIAGGVADVIRREGDLVVAPGGHTSPLEAPQVIADALGAVLNEFHRSDG
ncbi:alpha/beta hydrolase [Cryobacterium cheniae]|uniref:Alpha/beta hydrolase n=1 Tax=Cryobacterium cheniae TaxID=1259262 RepID=A0A4R8XQP2_9MICO|nr:alpha/beta hydrolase [Cryobacterium cheniae]TFC80564.1 alpha/beta hydrolase [Cryobacterium cheniae]